MKKAIFPGSFDPIHKGHIEIIKKATKLFDLVYVVVTFNNEKEHLSNIDGRLENVKNEIGHIKGIEIIKNSNLMTAELAKKLDTKFLIRSARNDIDFKYELELAAGNNHLNKELETILIIPDYSLIDYSSRLLKQQGEKK
ncbi:MAG: pantetheine-phosphate adenylyltransferase [Mycoplasma sp.]|nr:pantetheine-phosphate adenylyltransferase [Mycoplasma sp.]